MPCRHLIHRVLVSQRKSNRSLPLAVGKLLPSAVTAQFGFMRGVAGKNCQICQTTMDAEINRWPKRSDRLRNHDQRTQEELRYAPGCPRHFDYSIDRNASASD